MSTDDDQKTELLRRFQTVLGGAELDDLRELAGDLMMLGVAGQPPAKASRPELRRLPLAEPHSFLIRVDLKHSKPPIWRRLEIRSDLTLDVVHRVLQAAFDWADSHLWRFSLGGGPFDRVSQVFLCQWDLEEGEWDDDGGIAAANVRLDELLQHPGDVLSYVYDYGDNWELTLKLEEVKLAGSTAPWAVLIDGRQAAPPDDCGSLRTRTELAEILEDPDYLDIEEINAALRAPLMLLATSGFDTRLVALLNRLAYSPAGDDLTTRATRLLGGQAIPDSETVRVSFRPFIWFLDHAAEAPFQLTAAGYLKPADVEAAAAVLPTMHDWSWKATREIETRPVLAFRELLQSLGLLRKYKGTLRLTRAGANAQKLPRDLWNHLAEKLSQEGEGFDAEATLLTLFYAATCEPGEDLPLSAVANALNELGWHTSEGGPVEKYDLYRLPVTETVRSLADWPANGTAPWQIGRAAADLARAALRPR